jgi:phosphoribosylformylglycinamidine synthase PurS subunit
LYSLEKKAAKLLKRDCQSNLIEIYSSQVVSGNMSIEVDVTIKLKRGVADPEGENTKKALQLLGFNDVRGVKSLKTFRITLEPGTKAASADEEETVKREVDEMCRKLLANPVIHDYDIQVVQRDE